MSSVKDRLAIGIILDAEATGTLKPGQTVVEATSGNTGIALAMVCAVKVLSVRRFHERFVLRRTPQVNARARCESNSHTAAERGTGMLKRAEDYAKKHGFFLARQFDNQANPAYHRSTTGPEILQDFAGKRLNWFVTGWGTGGTLTGAGEMIKLARPDVKIIATEPEGAAMLSGKDWQPHKIQGWTPNLIPSVLNKSIADQIIPVADLAQRAIRHGDLATKEGIFCGISSGGTFAAALAVAKQAKSGDVILAMLPDTGERYLSTFLFEGINEGTDVELNDL